MPSGVGPTADAAGHRRTPLVLRGAELDGVADRTVLIDNGRIASIGGPARIEDLPSGAEILEARGGALIRGLNDHHLHLFAAAAAAGSVRCGPPDVTDARSLGNALRTAAASVSPGEWLRGVDYDDEITGTLSAADLDALLGDLADRPTRISHRSGHAWLLNTQARLRLGLPPAGALLLDADDLVRERIGGPFPSLRALSRDLAEVGVTGVTDAGAHNGPVEFAALSAASEQDELLQRCLVLGTEQLPASERGLVGPGAVKIVLAEHDLPSLDDLTTRIGAAGARKVALHAVSRETLALAAVALSIDGRAGHRVEHASVAPPDLVRMLKSSSAHVVTQPGFVHQHGDRYLRTVDPGDQPWLYRLRGWLDAGVPTAAGSDAPYGPMDPWLAMTAAVQRRTASGQQLGPAETLTPEQALALFSAPLERPGAAVPALQAGDRADLCLLSVPWQQARQELTGDLVRTTIVAGRIVHSSDPR